jgi:hypothetical protein
VTPEFVAGVHLERTSENVDEIQALHQALGGPVRIDGVLDDLDRQARRSRGWFGRAVDQAYTWDASDRTDRQWWPQGITTSADASDTEDIDGRRVLAVTWYAKDDTARNQGSRVSFLDLADLRYRHVLFVVPTLIDGTLAVTPLRAHAGGVIWWGPYLHVAATTQGFYTCRLDDIVRLPGGGFDDAGIRSAEVTTRGHRYVLPVRFSYRAYAEGSVPKLRYSFLSLDRGTSPPTLVVGEYGRRGDTTRLVRFPLDPATQLLATGEGDLARPTALESHGISRMQGAVRTRDRYYLSVSNGPLWPGTMVAGMPGALRRRRLALPFGPEDVTYWPSTDTLWSVSEYPRRRWIYRMRRSWFDA